MNTKFKRHQKVKLLINPLEEDIEPYADPPEEVKKGMKGKINVILPNGQYHVEVFNSKGETIAYAAMDEDQLELMDEKVSDKHKEKAEDWANH